MSRPVSPVALTFFVLFPAVPVLAQQASGLVGFHRSGQTFLTWNEVLVAGDRYRVYRHTQPITSGNLSQATRLTELDDQTSAAMLERSHPSPIQQNYVIQDLGPELSDGQGLFVFTIAQGGSFCYAVTAVASGVENTSISPGNSIGPLTEQVADPSPVLVWEAPSGWGRVYTQFMDYADWNPTFEGYAYNYCVTVPPNYDGQTPLALNVYMQGWGGRYGHDTETPYGWQMINVQVDDANKTWHYGFAESWDYSQGPIPQSGAIRNFTEERILRAVYDTARDPYYNVDVDRIIAHGQSMGGSGSITLGMRYPQVFAAVYGGEGMTDYASSTLWRSDFEPKWGTVLQDLPVVNRGRYASSLARYDGTGVYEWMDHQQDLSTRRGDEMAYIACDHGSNDTTIDWETEGRPWYGALEQGRRAFAGEVTQAGHTWQGFVGLPPQWNFDSFPFKNRESFPAFSYSTANSPSDPGPVNTTAIYNQSLEWSCSWNNFGGAIQDTPGLYAIALRSTQGNEATDVTPRRLQAFSHAPGQTVDWRVETLSGTPLQSGTVVVDSNGLVTVAGVGVSAAGVRLVLTTTPTSPGGNFVVAPGPGDPNPPDVRGYLGNGSPISALAFRAYSVAKWGANVASGNVDGAAEDEALTGPGPGSVFGPHVRAFRRTSAPLAKVSFYAYGTLRFGTLVAGAALDGDGPTEILTGAGPGAVFGPHVRGWNFDNVAVTAIGKLSFFAFQTLRYGVNVASGGVDADAYDEILVGPGPGSVFGSQLRGFDYDGAAPAAIPSLNAFVFSGSACGLHVGASDVDSDGFDEIACGMGPSAANAARLQVLDYDGGPLAPFGDADVFPGASYGLNPGGGEVDGDPAGEVLVGSGASPSRQGTLAGFDDPSGTLAGIPALSIAPFPGLVYGLEVSGGTFGY